MLKCAPERKSSANDVGMNLAVGPRVTRDGLAMKRKKAISHRERVGVTEVELVLAVAALGVEGVDVPADRVHGLHQSRKLGHRLHGLADGWAGRSSCSGALRESAPRLGLDTEVHVVSGGGSLPQRLLQDHAAAAVRSDKRTAGRARFRCIRRRRSTRRSNSADRRWSTDLRGFCSCPDIARPTGVVGAPSTASIEDGAAMVETTCRTWRTGSPVRSKRIGRSRCPATPPRLKRENPNDPSGSRSARCLALTQSLTACLSAMTPSRAGNRSLAPAASERRLAQPTQDKRAGGARTDARPAELSRPTPAVHARGS